MVARWTWIILAVTLTLALIGWNLTGAPKARRNALWRVVNYGCVRNQRAFGRPAPCDKVDLDAGYAVVPSVEHADELLLVPTLRISGIEDNLVLDSRTPNYWADAWAERSKLMARARRVTDDWVALAVNSAYARTQDQLHIHIDCLRGFAYEALRTSHIGAGWGMIEPFQGQRYWARYVEPAEFSLVSSFRIVAASLGGSPQAMGHETIVAVHANAPLPGFYVLYQAFDPQTHAHGFGEELLDHRCYAFRQALQSTDKAGR